jgi:hypothetical protein
VTETFTILTWIVDLSAYISKLRRVFGHK